MKRNDKKTSRLPLESRLQVDSKNKNKKQTANKQTNTQQQQNFHFFNHKKKMRDIHPSNIY